MSLPVRVAVAAMLLFVWTSAAIAFDDRATDAAFAALLSMPQAQPSDGDWGVQVPDGYDGKDETALIQWLAQQQKLGADFNQYRHEGTLLQHAMRSRLDSTALWLLRHGADPTLALRETEAPDALGFPLLMKNLTVHGYQYKEVVRDEHKLDRAKRFILDGLASGALKPIIDRTFPFERIVDAHRYLESNQQFGKIVVTV